MPKIGFKQTEEHKLRISTSKKGVSTKKPPFTEQHRRNIGLANRGSKHYRWKGGSSRTLDKIIRQSIDYNIWRNNIFQRDKYTCKICGAHSGLGKKLILNVDHYPTPFSTIIKQYNINTLEKALGCDVLWREDNGRTLCLDCHKKTKTFAGRMYKYG